MLRMKRSIVDVQFTDGYSRSYHSWCYQRLHVVYCEKVWNIAFETGVMLPIVWKEASDVRQFLILCIEEGAGADSCPDAIAAWIRGNRDIVLGLIKQTSGEVRYNVE